jgi:hypothetical protein
MAVKKLKTNDKPKSKSEDKSLPFTSQLTNYTIDVIQKTVDALVLKTFKLLDVGKLIKTYVMQVLNDSTKKENFLTKVIENYFDEDHYEDCIESVVVELEEEIRKELLKDKKFKAKIKTLMESKIINLFGGPWIGKSTQAS